jgi:putative glycosyltransferase (TIGR04372 family)
MGKFVQKPLDSQNPRVIDYASRFQSDFMDIFLSARCDFFIGQGSGITLLPVTFRRPVGFVNVVPLLDINDCHYDDCILIFKTFYSAERNRLLSFREMLDLGIGRYNGKDPRYAEIARKLGLEVRENSPEEIAEVAVEMHQRLHSVFSLSQEEEELQRRFMSMVESYPQLFPSKGIKHSRIGTHFLRTHRALLD